MKKKNALVYDVREIDNLSELVKTSVAMYPDKTAFLTRSENNDIFEITYRTAGEEIANLGTFLIAHGMENKKIALIGKNSYEWAISYLAVTSGVGVIVPLDKELKAEEIRYLLSDSEAAAVLCSEECKTVIDSLELSIPAYCFADYITIIEEGRALREKGDTSYESHKVDSDAMAALIYTSGTTGLAKGVMLSGRNIVSNVVCVVKKTRIDPEDRNIALLPMHHTYECMSGFLAFFYSGASIAFPKSLRHLTEDLEIFRPTVFIAVPTLLEMVLKNLKKRYAEVFAGSAVYKAQLALAGIARHSSTKLSKQIFSAVHKAFGGRLRAILCGAAPLAPATYRDYASFGLDIYLGYGLTETSPVILMHNDFYSSPNDVGYPIVGVQVKLEDVNEDGVGELYVKGPNVMLGYYKDEAATAAVMKDGWFATGDLVRQNKNGSYTVTGRKKSMIVISSGKKVFPEELEFYLDQSAYIAESLVYGAEDENGEVVVTANIFPNFKAIIKSLGKKCPDENSEEFDAAVLKIITGEVRLVNRRLPQFRCIRRIVIKKNEFEKTTTRKIKRNASNMAANEENKGENVQ